MAIVAKGPVKQPWRIWLKVRMKYMRPDNITAAKQSTTKPSVCTMTSSNGNIFRVTGPLCGEFTGHQWILLTKSSDAELWCFLWSALWINGWVNNHDFIVIILWDILYIFYVLAVSKFVTWFAARVTNIIPSGLGHQYWCGANLANFRCTCFKISMQGLSLCYTGNHLIHTHMDIVYS